MSTVIKKKKEKGLMPSLRTELNELFDFSSIFDRPFLPAAFKANWNRLVVPPTNIKELDNEFLVELAAPGMQKKDFEVDIDDGRLEIKVEKESETKEEEDRYHRHEYSYNAFYRSFELPENVKSDKISAEYHDGLLTVHLPKAAVKAAKKGKVISVK